MSSLSKHSMNKLHTHKRNKFQTCKQPIHLGMPTPSVTGVGPNLGSGKPFTKVGRILSLDPTTEVIGTEPMDPL